MPSLQENLFMWDQSYGWPQDGNEWSEPWGGPEAEWFGTILPRIHRFLPARTILEIAPGFGRWTQFLKDHCEQLIVVDLSEKCIAACRDKFSASSHIIYHVNDGRSLAMIADDSIDFVFSFDSLVHAEADVIESYLAQLNSKLTANGAGFIHHSNLGMYADLIARARQMPPESRDEIINLTSWRAETMTAGHFDEYCRQAGLQCSGQELINWFNKLLNDCFSSFARPGSTYARANRVIENSHFPDEVNLIKTLAPLYAAETAAA